MKPRRLSLENRRHQALAEHRLNLVNLRREFFYITPTEVKALLTNADGSVLEFVAQPEADEWHQSANSRRNAGITAPESGPMFPASAEPQPPSHASSA
jgi:hypothetical protein